MLNKQEIYNKVRSHLLTQGEKCIGVDLNSKMEVCLYRKESQACAVGCLISNEYYDPCIEGEGIKHIINMADKNDLPIHITLVKVLEKSGIPSDYEIYILLKELQNIHDYCLPSVWEKHLDKLAKKLNLEVKK